MIPHSNENIIHYQNVFGELQSALGSVCTDKFLAVGNFNAHPLKCRLGQSAEDFAFEDNLSISDLSLPRDSFTLLNAAHNTFSWLDHIMSSGSMNVSNISILHESVTCLFYTSDIQSVLHTVNLNISSR